MGSRPLTRRRPPIRWLLLLPVVGLSALFIRASCIAKGSHGFSWGPRKLVGSFPVQPSANCCATYYAPSLSQDSRGWLLDPISTASQAHISGAATNCKAVHVGQIKSGFVRGNHRHLFCNETLVVWGAKAKFRVENPSLAKGYAETFINMDEVGVLGCPAGRAHALVNMDSVNTLHILGCQDGMADPTNTEYNVWTNLKQV
eukprot:c16645_g1_i1 orf=111-713(+)